MRTTPCRPSILRSRLVASSLRKVRWTPVGLIADRICHQGDDGRRAGLAKAMTEMVTEADTEAAEFCEVAPAQRVGQRHGLIPKFQGALDALFAVRSASPPRAPPPPEAEPGSKIEGAAALAVLKHRRGANFSKPSRSAT